MTREEKIEAIYEAIADKSRTFGCRYLIKKEGVNDKEAFIERETEGEEISFSDGSNEYRYVTYWDDEIIQTYLLLKVIGHPVMIGDVLSWLEKNEFEFDASMKSVGFDVEDYCETTVSFDGITFFVETIKMREHKRKPIEDQSDECIDYVHSLISKISK